MDRYFSFLLQQYKQQHNTKFKQNYTLHWRSCEQEIDNIHEQTEEQEEGKPNVVEASATDDATAFNGNHSM